jgi:hypothetical protein
MLPPVLDESMALCPQLPPVWLPDQHLQALDSQLAAWDAKGDDVLAAAASLYHAAVRRCAGLPAPQRPAKLPDHPGLEFLADLSRTGSPDSGEREGSRERLVRRMGTMPPWAEAWARFAIGVSLLAEEGRGRRQQGLVSLAHLPARFARSQPFLAGLSLGYMAAGLDQTGDSAGAGTMRAQVQSSFPDHPVLAFGLARLRLTPPPRQEGP